MAAAWYNLNAQMGRKSTYQRGCVSGSPPKRRLMTLAAAGGTQRAGQTSLLAQHRKEVERTAPVRPAASGA
jgi:hypothetical protein